MHLKNIFNSNSKMIGSVFLILKNFLCGYQLEYFQEIAGNQYQSLDLIFLTK
jgi:hypothetical protein